MFPSFGKNKLTLSLITLLIKFIDQLFLQIHLIGKLTYGPPSYFKNYS